MNKIFKTAISAIIFAALVWSCSEQPNGKEFTGDFGNENAQYRNTETKNLSPYAIFGDSSFVLMTEAERTGKHSLMIPDKAENQKYSRIEINLRTGKVKTFDPQGNLFEEFFLPSEVAARFIQVDPSAESYPSISPYAYVANNPLIYIDPTGAYIEPASQKEWDRQTGYVESRRDKLQGQIDNLTAKAQAKGWSADKLAGKIGTLNERVASLNTTLGMFSTLENSTQGYSLSKGSGEVGGVTYDPNSGNIVISFGTTANFVHESQHAGQFESGGVAFDGKTGNTYLQDVGDEVAAYQAQFAYDPKSVSGLTSTSRANSFGAITPQWVQGVTTSTGEQPYAPGGSANTGTAPLNVNSTRADFIRAYPNNPAMQNLPQNFSIKSIPNAKYRGQ